MNTPNKITLSRLLLLPVIIFFYLASFIPYGRLVSAVVFVIACLTDFLDGYIARKYNQVTDLGKFFDAIADKCLIMTGLILIIAGGINGSSPVVYPSWGGVICAIVILAREFIVSALRQIAAAKGKVLAADKGGKIKAVCQYVVVTLYMFMAFFLTDIYPLVDGKTVSNVVGAIRFVLMILLILATLVTVYSGVNYLIRNRFVFMQESDNFKKAKTSKSKKKTLSQENNLTENETEIDINVNEENETNKETQEN